MTRCTQRSFVAVALALALAALVCSLAPHAALAQGDAPPPSDGGNEAAPNEFEALVLEAAEAYGNRDYRRALELFEQAYAIDAVPDLLYNMGVIADRMGDFDRALTYLNQFVVSPDIDIDARKDALSRIEQLKQLKALQEPQASDEPQEAQAPVEEKKEAAGPAPLPPAPPEEPDYVGPGIVLGLGLATLAAGGVTGGLALHQHDSFEEASTVEDRRDAADTGETLALVSDILLPTGGALAAAGIIWLAIEATTGETRTVEPASGASLQLAPSVSQEGLGLGLSVDF